HDLVIKEGDLVVATHGRSFWILDDISPLRELVRATPREAAHLFKPRDAYRVDWSGGFSFPPNEAHPVGKNPPNGAMIYYWLKDKAHRVTLDILDAAGGVSGPPARGRQVVHATLRAPSRTPLQSHTGGAARAVHVPEAAARHRQCGNDRGHHDPQRPGPARRPAPSGVRHRPRGSARAGAGRPPGGDRRRALPGTQPVVPGPVELSPEVGRADQRAERDGGGRRCPTARAGVRRIPDVRRGAAASAAGVAHGPG